MTAIEREAADWLTARFKPKPKEERVDALEHIVARLVVGYEWLVELIRFYPH